MRIKVNFREHVEQYTMVKLKSFTMVEKNQFMAVTFRTAPIIINLGGRSLPF